MPSGPRALPDLHLLTCWHTSPTEKGAGPSDSGMGRSSSSFLHSEQLVMSNRARKEFRSTAKEEGCVIVAARVLSHIQ